MAPSDIGAAQFRCAPASDRGPPRTPEQSGGRSTRRRGVDHLSAHGGAQGGAPPGAPVLLDGTTPLIDCLIDGRPAVDLDNVAARFSPGGETLPAAFERAFGAGYAVVRADG